MDEECPICLLYPKLRDHETLRDKRGMHEHFLLLIEDSFKEPFPQILSFSSSSNASSAYGFRFSNARQVEFRGTVVRIGWLLEVGMPPNVHAKIASRSPTTQKIHRWTISQIMRLWVACCSHTIFQVSRPVRRLEEIHTVSMNDQLNALKCDVGGNRPDCGIGKRLNRHRYFHFRKSKILRKIRMIRSLKIVDTYFARFDYYKLWPDPGGLLIPQQRFFLCMILRTKDLSSFRQTTWSTDS